MGTIKVYGQLQNCTVDGVLANTSEIYDTEQGKFLSSINSSIIDSLPKITENFEGAENDKGLRYVVRKNKLIAILKDGHVEYAPEGVAFVDAIEPTSFSIGTTTYEVPAGVSYVELGFKTAPAADALFGKGLKNNTGVRGFGLYYDGSENTTMGFAFAGAKTLEWLDLSGLETSMVTNVQSLFNGASNFRATASKLEFPSITRADSMFSNCKSLVSIDVTGLGLSNCTLMYYMFSGCSSLTTLDVSGWDTTACTNMSFMFSGCASLTTLNVSNWNTGACISMGGMFSGCSSLTTLDVSNWDTTACKSMDRMFSECSSLAALDVSGWNTDACTTMNRMFFGCSSLVSLDVSGWDFSASKSTFQLFRDCASLKSITLHSPNNPLLTDARQMFAYSGLATLDIDDFDVSAVTSLGECFGGIKATEIIIPSWTTPSLTAAASIFAFCEPLQTIDISGFIMTNVTDVRTMFLRCWALTSLKFPNMGQLKADTDNNKSIGLSYSPLNKASLDSIFSYDRTANGLTNTLTVQLSAASKALLTAEEIAAITAKGYTIA